MANNVQMWPNISEIKDSMKEIIILGFTYLTVENLGCTCASLPT